MPLFIKDLLKILLNIAPPPRHSNFEESKLDTLEESRKQLEIISKLNFEILTLQRRLALVEERLHQSSDSACPNLNCFDIKTMVCQYEHFNTPWFYRWDQEISLGGGTNALPRTFHRKLWEWYAIAQALWERGFLDATKKGLGFAVGTEPLSSLFANYGVTVLATDLDTNNPDAEAWKTTNQHADSLESLWSEHIISRDAFMERVRFQNADMKNLVGIEEKFDFVWSSCALEHLGSLEEGINFAINSSKLLKPGGIGIHTTEFNVASNDATLLDGSNVIYRKCDIEELDYKLRKQGMCLEEMDFRPGTSFDDRQYDTPPYYVSGHQHIKLALADHIATSLIFIIYT
ncbi:methyltransferase domain-containing protein [Myxacorys almedinensis A]|uniref:Methyltransferase domain-containing protein n=2 Tax=Myxacorys TaxID=2056239 RepID=A0A8J7Z1W8_9CYAN|nr:methyltransferase domain-containing protein [Myxacorys almedinensis A]